MDMDTDMNIDTETDTETDKGMVMDKDTETDTGMVMDKDTDTDTDTEQGHGHRTNDSNPLWRFYRRANSKINNICIYLFISSGSWLVVPVYADPEKRLQLLLQTLTLAKTAYRNGPFRVNKKN
jgi:PKD repeat protein